MRVLVTGATGYIGGRLVPQLTTAGYDVRCFARDAARLAKRFPRAEVAAGDVLDRDRLLAAMRGCSVAYYLIHSMSAGRGDFAQRDREAAKSFGEAARDAGIERIVYLVTYLVAALDVAESTGRIVEIGGADVLTYREMILRYAQIRGLRRKIFVVPVLTPRLSSYWVHLITPVTAAIARPLIEPVAVRSGVSPLWP